MYRYCILTVTIRSLKDSELDNCKQNDFCTPNIRTKRFRTSTNDLLQVDSKINNCSKPANHIVPHDICYPLQDVQLQHTCQRKHKHQDSLSHQAEGLQAYAKLN